MLNGWLVLLQNKLQLLIFKYDFSKNFNILCVKSDFLVWLAGVSCGVSKTDGLTDDL